MKLLLYCNKQSPNLLRDKENKTIFLGITSRVDNHNYKTEYGMNCAYERECCDALNGKIIGECELKIEEISRVKDIYDDDYFYDTPTLYYDELLKKSCLNNNQLENYLEFNGKAIHIKNFKMYDNPKELDYYHFAPHLICLLKDAPKNMKYVYDYKGGTLKEDFFDKKLMISVSPKEMCNIANGKLEILVRRKITNEVLKDIEIINKEFEKTETNNTELLDDFENIE